MRSSVLLAAGLVSVLGGCSDDEGKAPGPGGGGDGGVRPDAGAATQGDGAPAGGSQDLSRINSLAEIDCSKHQVPTFAQVTALAVCTGCHSSQKAGEVRMGAPPQINFDTYAAAKAAALAGAQEVFEMAMPPGEGAAALMVEQKHKLYLWARCGTPQ
jgi:hypothetical protein